MVSKNKYLIGHFYYAVIFFIISSINILPQDNTNNRMQDKTIVSTDDMKNMMEQNANYFSNDLKTRLGLEESQLKYVYDILVGYYSGETGIQTSQRAALREDKQSFNIKTDQLMNDKTNIEPDPLMYDKTNIKTDPLMQDVDNMATTSNNGDQQENVKDEAITKIESILDNEQANKWMEIKDSWWIRVKTGLYEGDQNIKLSKDIYEKKGEYEDDRDYENYDVYYPGYDFK